MVKINVGPKIEPEYHKLLVNTFKSANYGACFSIELIAKAIETNFYQTMPNGIESGLRYALDSFPNLYRQTLYEITGVFTHDELMAIIASFNGHTLTPKMSGQELCITVTDAIKYEYLDQQFDIDKEAIKDKIEKLTIFQRSAMELWSSLFWYGGKKDKNIDKYVMQLLA